MVKHWKFFFFSLYVFWRTSGPFFTIFFLCCPSQRSARGLVPSQMATHQEIVNQLWAGNSVSVPTVGHMAPLPHTATFSNFLNFILTQINQVPSWFLFCNNFRCFPFIIILMLLFVDSYFTVADQCRSFAIGPVCPRSAALSTVSRWAVTRQSAFTALLVTL